MPQEEIVKQVAKFHSPEKDKVEQERELKNVTLKTDGYRAFVFNEGEKSLTSPQDSADNSQFDKPYGFWVSWKIPSSSSKRINMHLNISVQSETWLERGEHTY